MNSLYLIILILVYFGILFSIAFWVEKRNPAWLHKAWVYALSLGVYCTAWTFYGSIGVASQKGLSFLTIYLGPIIAAPLWISVLTKIYRISKQQKVSSIADFISLRYGGNKILGALVTGVCLLAIIPYISLQLKAVAETFKIMTQQSQKIFLHFWEDSTFYIAILLALFAAFFGTGSIDTTDSRRGLVASLAFESLIKLLLFLIVGIWICFILHDGTFDLFQKITIRNDELLDMYHFSSLSQGINWFFMIALSFMAIFLLPRQFHTSVVELKKQKFINSAIWIFPLYLLLFNILVIFIAWAGVLQFGNSANADYFSLSIPLENGKNGLATMAFFGGFSAAISMVVISTLSLSIMLSNNVLIPYGFLKKLNHQTSKDNIRYIKRIRRISIFLIIIASYFFYVGFDIQSDLFSIGLVAFLIIAQLAPSFFGGLYWNRGSSRGANWGIVAGLTLVVYLIIIPLIATQFKSSLNLNNSQSNVLLTSTLFHLDFLEPIPNALYWSLLINTLVYASISILYKGNYRERNYAELFVNNQYYGNLQEEAFVWKGEAFVEDIKKVLSTFLGNAKTERALHLFHLKYNLPQDSKIADSRLINFSEKLLTGSIGATSSKILISNVVKEKPISLVEVLKILNENKKTVDSNKVLKEQSEKLQKLTKNLQDLNDELKEKDVQKDEFLDTVSHELKTPITSIKMSAEILQDDISEMPEDTQQQFLDTILKETDRITELISNILSFEKIQSGKENFDIQPNFLYSTFEKALEPFNSTLAKNEVVLKNGIPKKLRIDFDSAKMQIVFSNLISNALKFIPTKKGEISIFTIQTTSELYIYFQDNGKGIAPEDQDFIFDKFYQSKNQNRQKPKGSGLGLAICKSIVEGHNGEIQLNKNFNEGTQIIIKFPFK